jgi:hypothetical protein
MPASAAQRAKEALPIAVIDAETDPFRHGRAVEPFAWGFYNGIEYRHFWGAHCTQELLDFLMLEKPYQIFAHNGGRFDFQFFVDYLEGTPLVINGRIVDVKMRHHLLSDSYARIPVALERFGEKISIDYGKMEKSERDKKHVKSEILTYLERDCRLLYKVIFSWLETYGRKPSTMASAAFKQCEQAMKKPMISKRMSETQDEHYRKFYYGGRVQAFKAGILRQDLLLHDVNSMYPHVMCEFKHPCSSDPADWCVQRDISENTDFAIVWAYSKGALPIRTKNGLQFPTCYTRFFATGHEIRMAIQHRRLSIDKVEAAYTCLEKTDFKKFIVPLYEQRLAAKRAGNVMQQEFLKLAMNGTYGKFAINPRKFKQWIFVPRDMLHHYETSYGAKGLELCHEGKWFVCENIQGSTGALRFARRYDENKGFRNVALAASITGAARALLFDGLCKSEDPAYCDTDSIIGKTLDVISDKHLLGGWKLEAQGDEILIAGKKMYALLGEVSNDVAETNKRIKLYNDARCVKLASKGVRLTVQDLRKIANGAAVTYHFDAPSFDSCGQQFFQSREIRMTGTDFIRAFPSELKRSDLVSMDRWAT